MKGNAEKIFYGFRLGNLTVLDAGVYAAKDRVPLGGEWYTLALSFTKTHLDRILLVAPPEVAELLEKELTWDPSTPRTIDFEGEVVFGVRARTDTFRGVEMNESLQFIVEEITA